MSKKIAVVVAFPALVFVVGLLRSVGIEDETVPRSLVLGAVAAFVAFTAIAISFALAGWLGDSDEGP